MSLDSIIKKTLGRNRRAALNLLLMIVSIVLSAWIVILWASPMPGASAQEKASAPPEKEAEPARTEKASYDFITEKDLFRPERRRYTAPIIAKPRVKETKVAAVVAPPPPLKTPPPKLVLVGTALVDNGNAAILDYNGPVKKGFYKVGDRIEDFTISDIKKDSIVLERGGEYVKYMMNQAAPVFIGGSQIYNPSMPQPAITLR